MDPIADPEAKQQQLGLKPNYSSGRPVLLILCSAARSVTTSRQPWSPRSDRRAARGAPHQRLDPVMPTFAIEPDQRPNPATIQPSIPFAPSKIQHLPPDPADGEYNNHARTAVGHHSDHQFSNGWKTESASIQTEIRQMRQRTHPNGHSSSKIIQPNT
ncbi:hypothetical protein ACLOJK_034861 [Asimina triloba]